MRRNTTVSKWMLNHHWKCVYRLVIFNCIRPAPRISCCRTQTADRVRCEFGLASTIWSSTCGGNRIYFGAPSRQIPFQCGLYAKKCKAFVYSGFYPKKISLLCNFTVFGNIPSDIVKVRSHCQGNFWFCFDSVTRHWQCYWECSRIL